MIPFFPRALATLTAVFTAGLTLTLVPPAAWQEVPSPSMLAMAFATFLGLGRDSFLKTSTVAMECTLASIANPDAPLYAKVIPVPGLESG